MLAVDATFDQQPGYPLVGLSLEVAKGQVFELPLELADAQPIGQRGVQIERLLRDTPPLIGRLDVLEHSHVVGALGEFDQDCAYVFFDR